MTPPADGHLLIVQHGRGRGRLHGFRNHLLEHFSRAAPALARRIRVHETANARPCPGVVLPLVDGHPRRVRARARRHHLVTGLAHEGIFVVVPWEASPCFTMPVGQKGPLAGARRLRQRVERLCAGMLRHLRQVLDGEQGTGSRERAAPSPVPRSPFPLPPT